MAKKTDTKTLALLKEVQKRKDDITKWDKPNWTTNCNFSYVEGSSKIINLHVEKSVQTLVSIAAFLQRKEFDYNVAAKNLNVEAPAFRWSGFTVDEWVSDVKARINKVQIATKKKSLQTLEDRLNDIVSPDLRAEMELEAIAAELG